VQNQIRDVLEGIGEYRTRRPKGFLGIRPFLGVDTRHYGLESLKALLEEAFSGWVEGDGKARRAASRQAFSDMAGYGKGYLIASRFAGVKVYPPLGFDPWPDTGEAREKTDFLWSFCETRDIPVVTHCDDQGFRALPLESSWALTSPARWERALKAHPGLRLDFAHFGAQYAGAIGRKPPTDWMDAIVRLMEAYPRVFADISFDGSEAEYYAFLLGNLGQRPRAQAELIGERLMFGTDFMVNLSKIRSYSDYYRLFAASALGEDLRRRLCQTNPERFLFGD
jgi:predicted TIM-barrel fold metal-dependent hydrolase